MIRNQPGMTGLRSASWFEEDRSRCVCAKKKVLVFGGTGEIGSHVARGCVDAGHPITGLTRGQNDQPWADLAGVELLRADKSGHSCFRNTLAARCLAGPSCPIYA